MSNLSPGNALPAVAPTGFGPTAVRFGCWPHLSSRRCPGRAGDRTSVWVRKISIAGVCRWLPRGRGENRIDPCRHFPLHHPVCGIDPGLPCLVLAPFLLPTHAFVHVCICRASPSGGWPCCASGRLSGVNSNPTLVSWAFRCQHALGNLPISAVVMDVTVYFPYVTQRGPGRPVRPSPTQCSPSRSVRTPGPCPVVGAPSLAPPNSSLYHI